MSFMCFTILASCRGVPLIMGVMLVESSHWACLSRLITVVCLVQTSDGTPAILAVFSWFGPLLQASQFSCHIILCSLRYWKHHWITNNKDLSISSYRCIPIQPSLAYITESKACVAIRGYCVIIMNRMVRWLERKRNKLRVMWKGLFCGSSFHGKCNTYMETL